MRAGKRNFERTKIMTANTEIEANTIYDSADLSRDELFTLATKCNDAWARQQLRKLHFMILFALSEPAFHPVYDEDTGHVGPKPNDEPACAARRLAQNSMECHIRSVILAELGWTDETPHAPLANILALLPLDRLQPRPWPGE
jgi:hypothetical protein